MLYDYSIVDTQQDYFKKMKFYLSQQSWIYAGIHYIEHTPIVLVIIIYKVWSKVLEVEKSESQDGFSSFVTLNSCLRKVYLF
jgi:hypothetical protein